MASPSSKNLFRLLIIFTSLLLASGAHGRAPAIGVTYRHHDIPDIPARESVVSALRSAGVTHARLPDPDPATVRAFLYSGVRLLLSVPNSLIPDLAANGSAARLWLSEHVLPFNPRARIAAISIGDGVFSSSSSSSSSNSSALLPAIKNLHSACLDLGLRRVQVTTSFSFDALDPALPPSAARFRESLAEPYIRPLLDFLSSTGSPFLIELHPYKQLQADFRIPVGYALFEKGTWGFRDDPGTGLRYGNLFDAMLDASAGAVKAAGHGGMPVVVAGTGWPTGGGREATVGYARRYNSGLVEHLRSGLGTPMRREGATAVYIEELFDDPMARGAEWERHWGIWFANNLTSKYEVLLTSGSGGPGIGPWEKTVWVLGARLLLLAFEMAL